MPIGRIGQDFIVNTTTNSFQSGSSVAALADGRFVVTWESDDAGDASGACVRARVYNADGSPSGNDFILNTTTEGDQADTSITGLADGRFVATWRSDDTGDGALSCIRARVYDADGSALGVDFIVNTTTTGGQSVPSVTALADGRFVVMWGSNDSGDGSGGCVRARLYEAGGSAAGDDFIVNSTAAGFQILPRVTALADGRFVATWSNDEGDGDGYCIRARVYDADGNAAGNDFDVNTTTASGQFASSITALADGKLVMTWRSGDPGDGSELCIRGRVYNANGTAAGNDFIVNTTTEDDQQNPSVTALADGRFVVTWSSNDTGDGSGGCVRARLYNADGSAAGDDFIVNSTTADSQGSPSVEALADGRFVVTWTSSDPGDGSGNCIRSQIFDPTIFNGTLGEDGWHGGNFADRIYGGGSGDALSGGGGGDLIGGDSGNDILDGGSGNDKLFGGADNDSLNGGSGADRMAGGAGNDTYRIDNAGDRIIEAVGEGSADRVYASVSYQLAAGAEVEILNTSSNGGTGAINLVGNGFAQTIIGNAGNNVINGLGGADTMSGLAGNDRFYVDNAADKIIEAIGGGASDRVLTSVHYALKAGVEVEILSTTNAAGIAALKLAGNSLANTVVGNAGNNLLNGAAGADTLAGLGGDDTFMFNTSLSGGNVDDITDFNVADDTIRLENALFATIAGTGTLTAAQFVANASGTAQDASDRIIYETDSGRLIYDANGSTAGGRYLFATLDAGLAVTNADFFIV